MLFDMNERSHVVRQIRVIKTRELLGSIHLIRVIKTENRSVRTAESINPCSDITTISFSLL